MPERAVSAALPTHRPPQERDDAPIRASGPFSDSAPRGQTVLMWVAMLSALVWTLGLGALPLFDVDEGAFAEASRELLVSGDWGHTTLNGADRFDKPILVYWLQAAAMQLLGPTTAAARLPSALCAWAWGLTLALFLWPRHGARAALSVLVLQATALGPLLIGRAATADALLNLLLALTLTDLWRHLERQSGQQRPATDRTIDPTADTAGQRSAARPLRRAALWMGLGLLAKGPVAVLIPAAALALWLASLGPRPALRHARPLLGDTRAWLILLGTGLPWYAYAWARHGQAFIDGFFLRHNLQRFGGPLEGHGGSLGYYLLVLPLLCLPWAPLLWLPLRRLWRGPAATPVDGPAAQPSPSAAADTGGLWTQAEARWLLCWAGFVLVFFSLSGTKLPHYALYALSPLLLLVARLLPSAGAGLCRLTAICAAALVVCGTAAPWLAARLATAAERAGHGRSAALLASADLPAAPGPLPAALTLALIGVLSLGRPASRHGLCADLRILTLAAIAALWLGAAVLPWWAQVLQGPVQQLARRAAREPAPLVQWGLHQPSIAYVARRPTPRRAPLPGELALTWVDRIEPAPPAGLRLERLAVQGPYALVRRLPDAPAVPSADGLGRDGRAVDRP
ncbi:MAG: hypothetical protein RL223_2974 [Pseudomonadota bacterium]